MKLIGAEIAIPTQMKQNDCLTRDHRFFDMYLYRFGGFQLGFDQY